MLKEYELRWLIHPCFDISQSCCPFSPHHFLYFLYHHCHKSIRNINIIIMRLTCVFGWME